MRITRALLLSGAALAAVASAARADDLTSLQSQLDALDLRALAIEAAPKLPEGSKAIVITKGKMPVVPGLEESAREKAAFGENGTTLKVLPSADSPASPSISWSGYAATGLVYQKSN